MVAIEVWESARQQSCPFKVWGELSRIEFDDKLLVDLDEERDALRLAQRQRHRGRGKP